MRAISLGWGTQSFGLAAMSALGVLPPVDVAIHADTTHERSSTYAFAERWTPWLEERGVRVVTVKPQRCTSPVVNDWGGVFIPAFTVGVGYTTMYLVDGEWLSEADFSELQELAEMGETDAVSYTDIRKLRRPVKGQLRRQCTGAQ